MTTDVLSVALSADCPRVVRRSVLAAASGQYNAMSDDTTGTEPDLRSDEEVESLRESLEDAGGDLVGPDEIEGLNSA
ncbi:MAG: hypothetical protein JWP32_2515 [Schumannella sp.]|nr:hypothetical protein [Schumannella sp.]